MQFRKRVITALTIALLCGVTLSFACNIKDDSNLIGGETSDASAEDGWGDGQSEDTRDDVQVDTDDTQDTTIDSDTRDGPSGLEITTQRIGTTGPRQSNHDQLKLRDEGFSLGQKKCNDTVCVTGGLKP